MGDPRTVTRKRKRPGIDASFYHGASSLLDNRQYLHKLSDIYSSATPSPLGKHGFRYLILNRGLCSMRNAPRSNYFIRYDNNTAFEKTYLPTTIFKSPVTMCIFTPTRKLKQEVFRSNEAVAVAT